MGLFNHAHALRATILACGLAWFGPAMSAGLGVSKLAIPSTVVPKSTEPFGLSTQPVYGGGLLAKWRKVAQRIDEKVQLALCDGDRDGCASQPALQFLAIVDRGRPRDGRARLGEIINLANPRRSPRGRGRAAGRALARSRQPPNDDGGRWLGRNYRPLFVIDRNGVTKYSGWPLLAHLPDHAVITAAGLSSTDLRGAVAVSN